MIGFYIFFLCICAYNPIVFGINASNIICVLGFIVTIVRKKRIKLFDKRNPIWILFIAFYIISFASLIYSQELMVSIRTLIKFICLFIIVLWVNTLLIDKKNKEIIWNTLYISNIIACGLGIYQLIFGIGTYHLAYGTDYDVIRLVGAFPTPNIYANFLCITAPTVLFRIKKNKNSLLVLFANLIVLYRTYSRSSVLFFVVSIALYIVINQLIVDRKIRISPKKVISRIGIIAAITLLLRYLITSGKLEFLFRTRHSNSVRLGSYYTAVNMFLKNPIGRGLGVGIGELLDSGYLNIMVDLGIFGLIVIILIVFLMLNKAIKLNIKHRSIENQMILLTVILFWMINILENAIYNSLLNPILGIMICELYHSGKNIDIDEANKRGLKNENTIYK